MDRRVRAVAGAIRRRAVCRWPRRALLTTRAQPVLSGACLRHPTFFSIAHGCEGFQPIFGAPDAIPLCHDEWVNLVTGSTPCILHGDPRSPLGHVPKWLEAQN